VWQCRAGGQCERRSAQGQALDDHFVATPDMIGRISDDQFVATIMLP
jgi:hypothetical protein